MLSSFQFPHRRRVTASFGIASLPEDTRPTAGDLIRAADEALGLAKRAGKNRIGVLGGRSDTQDQRATRYSQLTDSASISSVSVLPPRSYK